MEKRYSPISRYDVRLERKRKDPQIHREGRSDNKIIMGYELRGQDPNLPTVVSLELDILLALGSRHEMAKKLYRGMISGIRYHSNTLRKVSPKLGFYRRILREINEKREIRRIEYALNKAGIMKSWNSEKDKLTFEKLSSVI